MKKSTFVRVASTLSAAALLGSISAHAEAPTVEPGVFQVGMEISYPPFESWKDGEVVGLDPELAKLLGTKMGVEEVEFKDNKFTALILDLQVKKYDAIISGMYIIPERLEKANAIPYARTGALIIVQANSEANPATERDLCGMRVGLEKGTAWVKELRELSETYCEPNDLGAITTQEFPSGPETAQALMSGNVDAEVEIAAAAQAFVEKSRGKLKISSPELIYPQTLGIYVHQDNLELLEALKSAMDAIREDGSYYELMKAYELTPVDSNDAYEIEVTVETATTTVSGS